MNHINIHNATVLVAGGAGFIGSAIVRELLKLNAKVVSFDNYLHGSPKHLEDIGDRIHIIQANLLDEWALMDAISTHKVEYIINSAGDTFVPTAYKMPKRFFDNNLTAVFNLLMAAKMASVKRIVHMSSTEVYGVTEGSVDESAPLNPVNTYAVSKLAADRLCATMQIEHNIPVVVGRIFNSYGPRETHPYIVPEIISQLAKSNVIQLGNIHSRRDLTFVEDTARAVIEVLLSDIPNGDVVNIGSNNSYSVEGMVKIIADIMGVGDYRIEIDRRRLRHLDIHHFRCNNTKLIKCTDWRPLVDIHAGMKKTVDWYFAHEIKWSWEDLSHDYTPQNLNNHKLYDSVSL